MLVTVNNRLKFEIEIVHDLSCFTSQIVVKMHSVNSHYDTGDYSVHIIIYRVNMKSNNLRHFAGISAVRVIFLHEILRNR